MPPTGFEPTISTSEGPQTYALDRAVTGTGFQYHFNNKLKQTEEGAACSTQWTDGHKGLQSLIEINHGRDTRNILVEKREQKTILGKSAQL